MKPVKKVFTLILGLLVIIVLPGACIHSDKKVSTRGTMPATGRTNQGSLDPSLSGRADPAAEKCVNDGFVLKPVLVNGVPVNYRCFDPETGKECDTWAYFRNECSLSKQ